MGYSIQRSGFIDLDAMSRQIVTDMVAAGFTLITPATVLPGSKSFVLKAGPTVDPLSNTQPWAIKLVWDKDIAERTPAATGGGFLDIVVATPLQFNSGAHATYERYIGTSGSGNQVGVSRDAVGAIGTALGRALAQSSQSFDTGFGDRMFIDRQRYKVANNEPAAYPMTYRLSVSDRGFALIVWEEGHEREANRYSWVLVQRPVDNKSGAVVTTGKAPVHCMYGLINFDATPTPWVEDNETYNLRRFVVREADVNVPYPLGTPSKTWPALRDPETLMGVRATRHTKDYAGVINGSPQVSISENNKYVLTFPNGLNTARYAYAHELDMLAYTSAEVVSEGTIVPVTVYGESTPRKYMALTANGPDNTGMRLLVLIEGGGVTPATA